MQTDLRSQQSRTTASEVWYGSTAAAPTCHRHHQAPELTRVTACISHTAVPVLVLSSRVASPLGSFSNQPPQQLSSLHKGKINSPDNNRNPRERFTKTPQAPQPLIESPR